MLGYFLFIGIGFMFIEIPLIQRLILFLGHPVYAFSIGLLSLLVSSGLGSLASGMMERRNGRFILIALFSLIASAALLYAYLLPPLFSSLAGIKPLFKLLFACIFIFPLGFLLGMPFPIGISRLGERFPSQVPWAWCMNGCASVVSSIGAVMVALREGFGFVFTCAALSYLAALLCLMALRFPGHRDKEDADALPHL